MRSRIGFMVLLLLGLALVSQGGAQQAALVSISITSPVDGYITVSSEVEIQGVVSATRTGIEITMVIVNLNGEAQKVLLESDGTFKTKVALENGKNLIQAIAITGDKELASTKIYVTRQNPILFFDDFETGARPEWSPATGTWVAQDGVYYNTEWRWRVNANTYVKTEESLRWRDYAVEVDVLGLNANGGSVGNIILRAQDDLNRIQFAFDDNRSLAWWVIKNGKDNGPFAGISPGLPDKARIRIEAVKDTYTVYVKLSEKGEFIKRGSWQNDTFLQGMPGLNWWSRVGAVFDNFKVESLEPGTPTAIAEVPQPLPPQQPVEQPTPATPTSLTELQDIKDRLNRMEPTVANLQTQVTDDRSRLSNLENRISSWGQDISSLKATVASLAGEHQSFTSQVQQIAGRVEALEKQPPAGMPSDMNARMQAIQQSLAAIGQTVKESRAEISELREEIQAAKGSAQLGLMAGIAGAALALLIALQIIKF